MSSGWSIGQSIHCICDQEVVGEVVVVGVGILNNDNEVGGGVVDENACDMSLVRLVVRCPVLRLVDLLNCWLIGWLCF